MQQNSQTGERWCVDKKTGALVDETKTKAGEPDPQCNGANSQGKKKEDLGRNGILCSLKKFHVTLSQFLLSG